MSDARLTLSGVACVRGGRMLLTGIDLDLRAGDSVVLRGPNGTGKSSLIRAVAGLLPVYAGTVERHGAMALADEMLALDMQASLAGALAFWTKLDGQPDDQLHGAMAALRLASLADVPVRMLSTGQRKRAVLARVMASGAPIWLLDEPANGLDTLSLGLLDKVMARHLDQGGIILAASHQPLPLPRARDIDIGLYVPDAEADAA
ncbi:heme ABC exporter ATP-binding protein CcmA [Sphingobium algorifonticola]|uniref:Heme ABC exporter ATP-binding protein CcmA n=1 Tax=Sphingobium algorifonticola TaxID=2008318 RepID=A0A437J698_9SPHN|nr:heme ABC exporter ATP-binding protein CcmA [Sphingobium algorifonticola]RVT40303.1 heme ABC exporter ATP-binding protein CcmA [Sphingobium algorifonticola]